MKQDVTDHFWNLKNNFREFLKILFHGLEKKILTFHSLIIVLIDYFQRSVLTFVSSLHA